MPSKPQFYVPVRQSLRIGEKLSILESAKSSKSVSFIESVTVGATVPAAKSKGRPGSNVKHPSKASAQSNANARSKATAVSKTAKSIASSPRVNASVNAVRSNARAKATAGANLNSSARQVSASRPNVSALHAKSKAGTKKGKRKKRGTSNGSNKKQKPPRNVLDDEEIAEMEDENGTTIRKKHATGQAAYSNTLLRTEVVMPEGSAIPALAKAKVDQVVDALSMVVGKVMYYQVKLLPGAQPFAGKDDRNFSRGGFTEVEAAGISHARVSGSKTGTKKNASKYKRHIQRPDLEGFNISVFLDSHGDIFAIILMNILGHAVMKSRDKLLEEWGSRKNWCKGCGLSGVPNMKQLLPVINSKPRYLEGYFGGNYKDYKLVGAYTRKERGTLRPFGGISAQSVYFNPDGDLVNWQMGNLLRRDIKPCKKVKKYNYIEYCWDWLCVFGPLVDDKRKLLTKEQMDHAGVAVNEYKDGDATSPGWHEDSHAEAACCISAMPYRDTELNSVEVANSDAGQLAVEFGGLLLPYGSKDLVIISGKHMHGPVIVAPSNAHKNKMRGLGKRQRQKGGAGRYSFILFSAVEPVKD